MAITYTYNNAANTSIKKVDDSTTPDTVTFIPASAGNLDYDALVAAGTSIGAYVYPGYDTIANARTSRIAEAKSELLAWGEERGSAYRFDFIRSVMDSTYTLPAGTQTKFNAAFTLFGNFETAINAKAGIEKVRTSTIDYEADSYNIPT